MLMAPSPWGSDHELQRFIEPSGTPIPVKKRRRQIIQSGGLLMIQSHHKERLLQSLKKSTVFPPGHAPEASPAPGPRNPDSRR